MADREDKKFSAWLPIEVSALLDELAHGRQSTKTQVVIDGILAIASGQQSAQVPAEILETLRKLEAGQASTQKALEEIRWMITKLER